MSGRLYPTELRTRPRQIAICLARHNGRNFVIADKGTCDRLFDTFRREYGKHLAGFATLDRPLQRLYANKAELLAVLVHPDISLHTNGSENDFEAMLPEERSAAAHAATSAATAGTPSLGWRRPVESKASRSVTTSAAGSRLRISQAFPPCPNSSPQGRSLRSHVPAARGVMLLLHAIIS